MTKAYSYPEPEPVWWGEGKVVDYWGPEYSAWYCARRIWYGREDTYRGFVISETYGPPVPSRRERRAADRVTPTNRTCAGCSVTIRNGTRADSRYCSGACRQRAYRQRVTDRDRRWSAPPVASRNAAGVEIR